MNMGGVSFHRPRPASRLIHAEGYAGSLMTPIHNFGLYLAKAAATSGSGRLADSARMGRALLCLGY